jgi:hypothetical protein
VNRRLEEILRRKESLIEQCALQREEFAALCRRIRSPFDLGRLVLLVTRALKAHPIAAAVASSLLASGYAGRLLRLTGEGLRLWRLIRPIWFWWKKAR